MSERSVELVPCDDPHLAWLLYGEQFMMRQADGSVRYFMRAEYATTPPHPVKGEGASVSQGSDE